MESASHLDVMRVDELIDAELYAQGIELLERMTEYAKREMAKGERLSWITRHMLGLYSGMPGAKEFRRRLSEGSRAEDAPAELILEAGRISESSSEQAA